ncbi:hypothetical protein ACYF6T_43995 [Streptomyces sp. 7R007]
MPVPVKDKAAADARQSRAKAAQASHLLRDKAPEPLRPNAP